MIKNILFYNQNTIATLCYTYTSNFCLGVTLRLINSLGFQSTTYTNHTGYRKQKGTSIHE